MGLSDLFKGGSQTVSTAPWAPQQPYLTYGFGQAQDLYRNPSPYLNQATNLQANRALAGSPLTRSAQDELLNVIQGNYLPGTPAFDTRFGNAMGAISRQITPQIDSRFASSGRFGSGLHKIGLGQALADVGSDLYNRMYEAERGRQMAGFGMAPSLASQDYYDINQLRSAGMAPWEQLQLYQNAIGGNYGGTQTTPTGSPLPALLGAGIGGFFGGGLPGASVGASLGGLLG